MLLAVLWSALSAPLDAPPSIASLENLGPTAIGEVVLKGRNHGTIESVTPVRGLGPPGFVQLRLTERPSRISGGCLRRRWTASFRYELGAAEGTAILSDAYPSTEVSLAGASDCATGEFAHVSPGLSIDEALSALGHLRHVRSGKAKVRFSCSDSTGSKLCRTPKMIRQELSRLPAWAVTKSDGNIELWLGKGGQAVTAVSFSEAHKDQVSVIRKTPNPF